MSDKKKVEITKDEQIQLEEIRKQKKAQEEIQLRVKNFQEDYIKLCEKYKLTLQLVPGDLQNLIDKLPQALQTQQLSIVELKTE